MNIKTLITTCLFAAGLALAGTTEASAQEHHGKTVVVKRKVVRHHHRHRIGMRHVGRGTTVKTTTKVETTRH